MNEKTTLAEFLAEMRDVAGAENLVRRVCASTFDEFVEILHSDLDQIVREMEREPNRHSDADEDGLTYHVATALRQRFYSAHQGKSSGGSVDLTVTGRRPAFSWTGEAKIFNTLTAVRQGFLQLDTRYRPADIENAKVGMLIYINRPKAANLMGEWREEMEKMGLAAMTTSDCAQRPNMAFYSFHAANYSGLPVSTRHMGVALYHLPEDKSGLTAKKYKKRRTELEQRG